MSPHFTQRVIIGLTILLSAGNFANANPLIDNSIGDDPVDCVPTAITDSEISCGIFEWRDGETYTESTNTATFLDESEGECGYLYTLNLIINHPGATHTVTNTSDSGLGSLRFAIGQACNGDTIRFAESISNDPIVLENGRLEIYTDLTIIGNARTETIIDGNQNNQVFYIPENKTVNISNLKITKGFTEYFGAGIENSGELFLTNVDIDECKVQSENPNNGPSGGGAAIANNGLCQLVQCKIRGNKSISNFQMIGGAITNTGYLKIINSQISGNVIAGGYSAEGGGIHNDGTLTIHNSVLSGNASISMHPNSGELTETDGAAIFSLNNDLAIYNSIIWGNNATASEEIRMETLDFTSEGTPIYNTLIKGKVTDNFMGTETPMFTEPIEASLQSTVAGDFKLTCFSSLIDLGKNQYYPAGYLNDLAGNERFQNGNGNPDAKLDLGPYEFREIQLTVDTQVACNMFIWDNGMEFTESTNDEYITLTNTVGCDSIIQLNLTINQATEETDVQHACGSYTWIDGNTYTEDNNAAAVITENENGCAHTTTLDLSFTTIDASIIEERGGVLTASQPGLQYQWLDCDDNMNEVSGENYPSFTPQNPGSYALKVSFGDCSDISDCTEGSTTGIEENTLFDDVSIFPNPTAGKVTINLGSLRDVDIKVMAITGKEIAKYNSGFDTQLSFEINQAQGIYFIELSLGENRQYFKLIKQ